MLQTQLTKSFADTKERTGFGILSLIPTINSHSDKTDDSSLCDAELLLGEEPKNLNKVNIMININTTVLPQMGLFICANTVLLCRTFAQVQCISPATDNSHPPHSSSLQP